MKRGLYLGLVSVFVFASCLAFAFDGVEPGHKHFGIQTKIFTVIHQNWVVQDLYSQMMGNSDPDIVEKYTEACEIFEKASADLGKTIVSQFQDPNLEVLKLVSEFYKSLDGVTRGSLYSALSHIKFELSQNHKPPITEQQFREYFPGYGYSEPGFKYRKGREIDRENKGTTWQSEEHSITTTFSVELTINIDLLDILKGLVTSGAIKNLKVGEPFEATVNGEPMIVVKVSFQVVKSIVTKTTRKFDVNKIWFELLRAKILNWGSLGPWEVCGKTYEIINEPTGDEIVTGINQGKK